MLVQERSASSNNGRKLTSYRETGQQQSHVTESPAHASRIRPELPMCTCTPIERMPSSQTAAALQVDRLVSGGSVGEEVVSPLPRPEGGRHHAKTRP